MKKEYDKLDFVLLDDQAAVFQNGKQIEGKFIDIGGIPEEYWHLIENAPMMYNHFSSIAKAYNGILPQLELAALSTSRLPELETVTQLLTNIYILTQAMKKNIMNNMRCAEVGKYRAMMELKESEEI